MPSPCQIRSVRHGADAIPIERSAETGPVVASVPRGGVRPTQLKRRCPTTQVAQ